MATQLHAMSHEYTATNIIWFEVGNNMIMALVQQHLKVGMMYASPDELYLIVLHKADRFPIGDI